MRDAEDELSQDDSAVKITPLPAEKELPAGAESKSARAVDRMVNRVVRSGAWRYILTAVALCLALAFLLANIVQLPHSPSKQSSRSGSPAAVSTATPAIAYVPTDYSVNTTIVNGVAYVGAANGAVYALRTSNGSLLWRHKINPGAGTAPLVDSGIVYITAGISDTGPGYLYALRASDGTELWRYTSSDPLSAPPVANGIVYVTSYDIVSQNGSLIALRGSDGAQLWQNMARGSWYNSLVVDKQVVFVSTSEDNGPSTVYALRESDGTRLWHYTATTFTSVPAVINGIAYLFSGQGLSALQASNGRLLWRDAAGGDSGLPPQVIDGVLYLITTKISLEATNKGGVSTVYAVRISDGAVLWHYTMSKENGNNWANWFSIENGTIYAGTNVDQDKSYIYALRSSDGSLLWRQAMRRGMSANALVANGAIYIASFINDGSINQGSGAVYALRASDGTKLWYHYPIYWVVYNPPMVVGETIYVSTTGGDVYAFRASSGSMLWHFHTDVQ